MKTKLAIACMIAQLCYLVGGFGILSFLIALISGSDMQRFAYGSVIFTIAVGFFFDLLAEIGWRVSRLTEPDKADYDPRA